MLKKVPHWVEAELTKLPDKLTLRKLAKELDVQLVPVGDCDRYPHPASYGWLTVGSWEKYGDAPTLKAHAFFRKRQNNDAKIIVMYTGDLHQPQVVEAVVHELAHIALDMGEEKDAYEWAVSVCTRLPNKEVEPLKAGVVEMLTSIGEDIEADESLLLVNFMLENTHDLLLSKYANRWWDVG